MFFKHAVNCRISSIILSPYFNILSSPQKFSKNSIWVNSTNSFYRWTSKGSESSGSPKTRLSVSFESQPTTIFLYPARNDVKSYPNGGKITRKQITLFQSNPPPSSLCLLKFFFSTSVPLLAQIKLWTSCDQPSQKRLRLREERTSPLLNSYYVPGGFPYIINNSNSNIYCLYYGLGTVLSKHLKCYHS